MDKVKKWWEYEQGWVGGMRGGKRIAVSTPLWVMGAVFMLGFFVMLLGGN